MNETTGEVPTSSTQTSEPHASPKSSRRPSPLTTARIADCLLEHHHFAKDASGRIYHYRDGAYHSHGDRAIRFLVREHLKREHRADEWSSHKASEVIAYIGDGLGDLWNRPPIGTVNLTNGLLDIETGRLRPHDPGFLSPIQLPVAFDPKADCDQWDEFSSEVLPADCRDHLCELSAWLMLPNQNIQKSVLFIGPGGNGKSTALAAVVAFLGRHNCTGLSLHRLERDRFATSRLIGKLANICADIPSSHLETTSIFKALTGDDPILTVERKHSDSFEFECFARLVFSANHPPRSSDSSEGFFRRWLVIPFERQFAEGTEAVAREALDERLHHPRQLSGVLNRALKIIPRLHLATALTETASMLEARDEFRKTTDPLGVWLDRNTVLGPAEIVPRGVLFRRYSDGNQIIGRQPMTRTSFGLALKRMRPGLGEAKRTIDGSLQWCYIGIGLTEAAKAHTT